MDQNNSKTQGWLGEPVSGDQNAVQTEHQSPASADTPPTGALSQSLHFEFRGTGREYFKVWVVNLALSILTLGIYSPWAKVRKLRYFYGNTYLDGSSFEFVGSPISILKGRIIAVAVFVCYWVASNFFPLANLVLIPLVILLFPWVMVKALDFRARNSAYRNLTFSYHGSYRQVAAAYFSLPVIFGVAVLSAMLVTGTLSGMQLEAQPQMSKEAALQIFSTIGIAMLFAGMAFPYFLYLQKRVLLAPRSFGDTRFSFNTGPRAFYGLVMRLTLLTLLALIVGAIIIGILMFGLGAQAMKLGVVPFIVIVLLQFLIYAAYITMMRNLTFSAVCIGDAQLSSKMRIAEVAWLYFTNLLAIVVSVGLLTPWAKVRIMRYQAEKTALVAPQGTDGYTGSPGHSASATGEELTEVFDVDLSI